MTRFTKLALAAALVGCAIGASAQQVFKIGVVIPFSGPFGVLGQNTKRGIELAIEERGGKVAGRPIEVTWEDSETKPQVAVQKTARLLASGLDTLFGAASSAETIAMLPLAAQAKVPHLVTMSADDRITGSNKTRYSFRTTNYLGMENVLVADHIKSAGLKKVYGVASDVGVTRDGWGQVRDIIAKAGVAIAGEDFPPMGSKDLSVIVDKALRSGADAVVFVGAGNDAIGFLKQAHEVGLTSKTQILGPVLIDDTVAKAVGPAAEGVMSALRYHASLDNAANKKFVSAYHKKYGEAPDMVAGESYDGMSWWLDVVEKTGGTDKEKWIDAFVKSTRLNSVKGTKTMRACDNQAEQVGIWGKGVKVGNDYAMAVTRVLPSAGIFSPCK
jgi:ABC-type branched-subunit amino acid transport system substrate-binding protein